MFHLMSQRNNRGPVNIHSGMHPRHSASAETSAYPGKDNPPLMLKIVPVTWSESGEAKYNAASATSSGLLMPNGIHLFTDGRDRAPACRLSEAVLPPLIGLSRPPHSGF